MEQLPLGVQLRNHARFATFVAGANGEALDQARELARGASRGCVTWLWGAAGTGKTHLLQAACAGGDAQGRRAGYLALSDRALVPAVLDGWDGFALVCADDLQQVVGDVDWERALFLLFNALSERGGSLLVASDRSPGALAFALPDLDSRLRSGPVFQLAALNDSERLQALQLHAKARGLALPSDTARFVLRRMRRDMHTLSALLDRLDRASLAAQRRLTIPFVRELLGADGE
jgi:DnaA-homolog protein